MILRLIGIAVLAVGLGGTATAQVPQHNAAKFAEVFVQVEEIFGGRDAFQTAYEEARAEQARMEGALQLSLNLEKRFRENGAADAANVHLKSADALKISVETLRTTFAKFEALDSPLDEALGRAAYDRVTAEHAALFQRPMTEQIDYSKAHTLNEEPLKSVQMATQVLIAIATKPAG